MVKYILDALCSPACYLPSVICYLTTMTLKTYLIIMLITTLLCWSAFVFVSFNVNPDSTNWIGFTLFYLALFLSVVGTTTIVGFLIRFVGLKRDLVFRSVRDAFRQSFLFSFFIISTLILLSQNLFSWLNLFFLVVGLSVLEFFLISYSKPYQGRPTNIDGVGDEESEGN